MAKTTFTLINNIDRIAFILENIKAHAKELGEAVSVEIDCTELITNVEYRVSGIRNGQWEHESCGFTFWREECWKDWSSSNYVLQSFHYGCSEGLNRTFVIYTENMTYDVDVELTFYWNGERQ